MVQSSHICTHTCLYLSHHSQEGKQALFRAAKSGDMDAVKRQLSGHVDINSQDQVQVIKTVFVQRVIYICLAFILLFKFGMTH